MRIPEEVKNVIDIITKEADNKITSVISNYAERENPYKKGDILKDHYQIGKVKSIIINVSTYSNSYVIIYICDRLKVNLEPFKSGEQCSIYLSNVEHKII